MVIAAAAIAGSALLGAGASIYAANKQAGAAQDAAAAQVEGSRAAAEAQIRAAQIAADTQLTAQDKALAFQRLALEQSRSDLAPYRQAGGLALEQMTTLTRPGGAYDVAPSPVPEYHPFTLEDFQQDPGYKFRVAEGLKALDRTASARGGLVSGRALKDVTRFGQDMAAQEYQAAYGRHTADYANTAQAYAQKFNVGETTKTNQFNRLASVAGIGQAATQQLTAGTLSTGALSAQGALATGQGIAAGQYGLGAQLGSNIVGAANARASGYVGAANAYSGIPSTIAGVGNSLAQYQLLSKYLQSPNSQSTPGLELLL